jgi:hypothetical protein
MNWILNFLVKLLGAFLTSMGLFSLVAGKYASIGWVIGFLTVGLALLFAPKIEMK